MRSLARPVLGNLVARVAALIGLTAATVVVARLGGNADVGGYALLRMLPGLVGVLSVAGLPGAMAYFLAEPRRLTPRLWPSIACLAVLGSVVGAAGWAVVAPLVAPRLFPHDSTLLIAAAAVTVPTQLFLTVGKTALQGLEDRRGGDVVIAAEELAFLPCYGLALAAGLDGTAALMVGLALADLLVGLGAWHRVARRLGWYRPAGRTDWRGRPDRQLLREIASYGMRGQVGGLITLLNLRLDFLILGMLSGPAVLGVYAVASKYAELLRLPGTALTWVTYPRLTGADHGAAVRTARRLVLPSILGIAVVAVVMMLLTGPVMRLLYGASFDGAVTPARILVVGMLLGGAAGVSSGLLYARGRPGLNSVALGCGLIVTAALDLLLIPRFQEVGAAVASTVAYLTGDALLVTLLLRTRPEPRRERPPVAAGLEAS